MDVLSLLGTANTAVSGVGSLVDGLSSLFGGSTSAEKKSLKLAQKQYEYQRALNTQQQAYAQENRMLDDKLQRNLTQDNALLQQVGKIQAGINPATGDGTVASAASGASTAAPSAGSAPSMVPDIGSLMNADTNRLNAAQNMISQSVDRDAKREDTRGKRIQNDLDQLAFDDKLETLHNEKKISDEEYEKRKRENRIGNATEQAQVEQQEQATQQSQIETRIKALQEDNQRIQNDIAERVKLMNDEQLKQLKFVTEHQLQRYRYEMAEVVSRIKANNASASASYAQAAAARAQAVYTGILSKLEDAKVQYADQIAKGIADQAENSAKEAYERYQSIQLQNKDNKNRTGVNEKGEVTDWVKYGSNYVGDILRNALGGILSGSVGKTFK